MLGCCSRACRCSVLHALPCSQSALICCGTCRAAETRRELLLAALAPKAAQAQAAKVPESGKSPAGRRLIPNQPPGKCPAAVAAISGSPATNAARRAGGVLQTVVCSWPSWEHLCPKAMQMRDVSSVSLTTKWVRSVVSAVDIPRHPSRFPYMVSLRSPKTGHWVFSVMLNHVFCYWPCDLDALQPSSLPNATLYFYRQLAVQARVLPTTVAACSPRRTYTKGEDFLIDLGAPMTMLFRSSHSMTSLLVIRRCNS